MEGFKWRKFFAREPMGFSARRLRRRAVSADFASWICGLNLVK